MSPKLVLVLILLCSVFAPACKRQPNSLPPTNKAEINQTINWELNAENELREKVGLRLIKSDWFLYRDIGSQEDWKIHKDGFPAKTVFKDSHGHILADEDYYYSGNEFDDSEGHGWEHITVHYDFGSKKIYLAYTGTNKMIEASLSKYFMTVKGASSEIKESVESVRKVAGDWPDGPK